MARLFADLQIKLLCILLAFGLWFFVSQLRKESQSTVTPEMSSLQLLAVPVQLEGTRATMVVAKPSSVDILVQWHPQNPIPTDALDRIYAVIPTDDVGTEDEQVYSLSVRNFVLPPGWILVDVNPARIELTPLKHGDEE